MYANYNLAGSPSYLTITPQSTLYVYKLTNENVSGMVRFVYIGKSISL